jgi:hypothetical protein
MKLELVQQPTTFLPRYAMIPIAFEVRESLHVELLDNGLGGVLLRQRAVEPPYVKDYDALPEHAPPYWPRRWDLSKWLFIAALLDGQHVGGVAVVLDTTEVDALQSRANDAILWDIRVSPANRH